MNRRIRLPSNARRGERKVKVCVCGLAGAGWVGTPSLGFQPRRLLRSNQGRLGLLFQHTAGIAVEKLWGLDQAPAEKAKSCLQCLHATYSDAIGLNGAES